MLKVVIGGQIGKQEIAQILENKYKDKVTYEVKNDLDAVMAVKSKTYDYYLGACNTGGGGALAMAIALLGKVNCLTVASPGGLITDEEILKGIEDGQIAFGFTPQYADKVVPVIINALLAKTGN